MDYSRPTLLVISGPNGAGKSTHIQTMLPDAFSGIWSFDRDNTRIEFEKQLTKTGVNATELLLRATRMMEDKLIEEMKRAIREHKHFVLETPLSHPDYWRYIDLFENNRYQIQLNYLCLDKISDCIARVGQRVMEGGHYVEPSTIKGVYEQNLRFINDFTSSFKVIELYDGTKIPTLLAKLENGEVKFALKGALKKNWIKSGLPNLSALIKQYTANVKKSDS
ncbi:zeta toxin family protein [Pedobacter sp.]|uniref:zeta toxin family protein n=1 Tax=Pedobacter sp. TaxID=1411316 RepID=UPI003D7FABA3